MLDFDGVLHPAQGNHVAEFAYAPRLAACLEARECEVVISSTWREHHDLTRLRSFLPHSLAARVIGALGDDCRGPHIRQRTILVWLEQDAPGADWRALDDTASEFAPGCSQLTLCDGRYGVL